MILYQFRVCQSFLKETNVFLRFRRIRVILGRNHLFGIRGPHCLIDIKNRDVMVVIRDHIIEEHLPRSFIPLKRISMRDYLLETAFVIILYKMLGHFPFKFRFH